jgi:Arc/MetJ-type ribon-helix-helix transcriptional regulator
MAFLSEERSPDGGHSAFREIEALDTAGSRPSPGWRRVASEPTLGQEADGAIVVPATAEVTAFFDHLDAAAMKGLLARQIILTLPHSPLFLILKAMEVHLTPDQKAFARRAIESGRLHSEEDAVEEALALWEERERQRAEFLVTLDEARASLARGEGRVITQESMRQLASEAKERGRTRLLAELATSR